ncbi:MAG: hypothetical protein A3E85_05990 [Gammaproteobacteria bacterium RIFCSPHIGHO2_12_FULL_45_12]|nr:MAG: hypothetical protein A3E85_05990 [Gammaproteobacteria bacterium RIFCSPHIGHO2_12_FULL_45_12]
MRTILKLSIAEAIGDPNILCRLIPIQACWLGYYSSLSPEECKGLFVERKGLLLRFKKGRYKMLSLDRKGMISFLDARTNTTHTQRPVSIAQDPALISSFDPSQACYIGMLAGIDRLKGKPSSIIGYQAPKLRLVK